MLQRQSIGQKSCSKSIRAICNTLRSRNCLIDILIICMRPNHINLNPWINAQNSLSCGFDFNWLTLF